MTDYNDGEWWGWNGGECPVHTLSEVDRTYVYGYKECGPAGDADWSEPLLFRVTKPYVEPKTPREWWIVGGCEAWDSEQEAIENSHLVRGDITHVREVIDE